MLITYIIGLIIVGALLGYVGEPEGPDETIPLVLGAVLWPATLAVLAGDLFRDYLASRRA